MIQRGPNVPERYNSGVVHDVSTSLSFVRGSPPPEYRGFCRRCAREHRIANDGVLAITALDRLFGQLEGDPTFADERAALAASPGKMIGVLVAEAADGTRLELRAYSGELGGRRDWPAWVGPVLRRADTAALEEETLAQITALEAEIATCDVDAAHRHLNETRARVQREAAERRQAYRAQRHAWSLARRNGEAVESLVEEARRTHEAASATEAAQIEAARQALLALRERLHHLREARKRASQRLSTAMFDAAAITNARGERLPLREVFVGDAIAGGTTDCTVPKLLEAANVARLRPVAMAEAWWGPTLNDRHHGDLQTPCERKCQPVLGHLLCGMDD